MEIIEVLKNFLFWDQKLLVKILQISGFLTILYAIFHYAWKGIKWLYQYITRESLYKKLKPYFTKHEILRAIENYIPTKCQNVDPAMAAEPGRTAAFATREKLIPFFINKVFKEKKDEKFYLILADSGMGKTTFMINLFLRYMRKWFKKYNPVLLPLGHPKTDEKIAAIENKTETILLLDAFDEDIRAAKDYKSRMETVISMVSDFQTVIITSRSQFFPSDRDIPQETGLYKFGGQKGIHCFYRLYVSPFNAKDINRYLRRKYSIFRLGKQRKARSIVKKSPDLMVRPMLLSNIEDLLERKEPYEHTYEIYEEMVKRWIQRERVTSKKELRRFSEVLARDMYEHQRKRGGFFIEHEKVGEFAKRHHIHLEEFEMRSRSLLNRNAEGKYKFAHKSILEYMLSLELLRDWKFKREFNFENMEVTRQFYNEQFSGKVVISYYSQRLHGEFRLWIEKNDSNNNETRTMLIERIGKNDLKNISYLYLRGNKIESLSPLSKSKKLQILKLPYNQIIDLNPLSELKNLQELHLGKNQITDLSPLSELKDLHILIIPDNNIKDLTPLSSLKNLRELHLDHNQISDISPLSKLENLERILLRTNFITDIGPLLEIKNLEYLDLRNNPTMDYTEYQKLRAIVRGELLVGKLPTALF
jgi:hypothetical protein